EAEALDASPEVLQTAGGLGRTVERGELVRNDSHRPGLAGAGWKPHDLGRGFALVAGAEWTAFQERRHRLWGPMCGQLLGALGGDDDPFLGEEILAQLRHGNPPTWSIDRTGGAAQ